MVATVDTSSSPAPNCVNETRASTLTTASGDQITLTGPGVHCTLVNPQGTDVHNTSLDSWTVTGGTGSLAGATGSGTNSVNINPLTVLTTSVTIFSGTLTP
jgi:hypothetical protein